MVLDYDGKKTKESILSKAKSLSKGRSIASNKSLLINGDNFYALSLLQNNYNNKIDLIYIDPPFNTNQVFNISKDRVSTISRAKGGKIAYEDALSKEEFLEFLRERIILLYELLSDEGSFYLHIDYKIGHYVKIILDEIFGEKNFKNDITRIKSNPKNFNRKAYGNEKDLILFYAKNTNNNIWNDVKQKVPEDDIIKRFNKIDKDGRRYTTVPLHAPGETVNGITGMPWRSIEVPKGRHWRTNPSKFDELDKIGMIEWSKTGNPRIKKYADECSGKKIQDIWDFKDPQSPIYPTEKNIDMLDMIIKQSSNISSIVLDCFAGSGSTLQAAYNNERKFIGIDNSKIAIDTIKKRNLGQYDYIRIDNEHKSQIKELVLLASTL